MTSIFGARPDRVSFPDTGFTKDEAIAYYVKIAPLLLPHLKSVPVSLKPSRKPK